MTNQSNGASGSGLPGRFAHPFFSAKPPADRTPIDHMVRMTDWSKKQLGPIPPITGNGVMTLADVIGSAGVSEIESVGEIRFHAVGDTGVGHAHDAEEMSEEMAGDYSPTGGGMNPAFLMHLGDILYGPGKEAHYTDRFYRPYRHYPGKIIAIPGNHDGEVRTEADKPSLTAYLENFCLPKPSVPEAASSVGIYREMVSQPGAYWMLDAPFVRIIGLYSNLLENPGYLQGMNKGKLDVSQIDWLTKTLKAVKKASKRKALVFATHHPPYSSAGHSGSTEMNDTITAICTQAGIFPDLFISGHAHNYQRYTRSMNGKKIPYIVAGTGGMPPQALPEANGQPSGTAHEVTYDKSMKSLGYVYVTISKSEIKTEFWPVGNSSAPFDPMSFPLSVR